MKRILILPILAVVFTAAMVSVCLFNEVEWDSRTYDSTLRGAIGLPSIAIGCNYEGTRNPLLEIFVRSLYDVPGGHDYVVASSFIESPIFQQYYREGIPGFNLTWEKG